MKKNAHTTSDVIQNYRADGERRKKNVCACVCVYGGTFHCDAPKIKSDESMTSGTISQCTTFGEVQVALAF